MKVKAVTLSGGRTLSYWRRSSELGPGVKVTSEMIFFRVRAFRLSFFEHIAEFGNEF